MIKFVSLIAVLLLISLCWYSIVIFKTSNQLNSTANTNPIKGIYQIIVNQEHVVANHDSPLREFVIKFTITNHSSVDYKLPVPELLLIKYGREVIEIPVTKKFLPAENIGDNQFVASGDQLQFALPFHGSGLPKNLSQLEQSTMEWLDSKNKSTLILKYQP